MDLPGTMGTISNTALVIKAVLQRKVSRTFLVINAPKIRDLIFSQLHIKLAQAPYYLLINKFRECPISNSWRTVCHCFH